MGFRFISGLIFPESESKVQDDIIIKNNVLANLRSFVGMLFIGLFIFTVAYMMIGKLNAESLPIVAAENKIVFVNDFASFVGLSYVQMFNSLIGFCGFVILAVVLILGIAIITRGKCEYVDDKQTYNACEEELSVWQRLNLANHRKLAQYLKRESPQTIGVILSQLSPVQASKVLERFDEDFSLQVMMCMLNAKEIAHEVVGSLESSIRKVFFAETNETFAQSVLMDILSLLGHRIEKSFWRKVQGENEAVFGKLNVGLA